MNISIARETVLYGVSIAAMRGVSLIMLPIITHYLSTEAFGRVEVLTSIAMLGSVIVGMGLENALYRFYGFASEENKKKWAANIFSLTLLIGVVFAAFAPLLSGHIAALLPITLDTYSIEIVLYILALEGIIAVPLGWLRMVNRAGLFCVLSLSRVVIHACATWVFLEMGRGVAGVFEAGLLAALFQAIALGYVIIRSCGLILSPHIVKKAFTYSFPIVGSGILAFMLNGLDRFVIASYVNMESVAIFSVATKFSLALTILIQPFGMWWQPKRFAILASDNGVQKTEHYSKIGLTLLTLLFLVVGIAGPLFIDIFLPEAYHQAKLYFFGLLLVVFIKETIEFVNISCFKNESTKGQLTIELISAVIGGTLIFLGALMFSLWGVIFAIAATQTIRLTLFCYIGNKILAIHYPIRALGELLMLSAFFMLLSLITFHPETLFDHFPNTFERVNILLSDLRHALGAAVLTSLGISLFTLASYRYAKVLASLFDFSPRCINPLRYFYSRTA